MEQNASNLFDLQVDHSSSAYLKETAKWAKFLAIVGFIVCALVVLAGIFAGSIFASLNPYGAYGGGFGVGMAIYCILIALLYFFPCLYLFRFATRMQVALANNDQPSLVDSFKNLKSCYKFVGILTIIALAFYALMLIFMVLGATMASF